MTVTWEASYAIDNGVIDADHKAIIVCVNELHELLDSNATAEAVIGRIIDLKTLARMHFEREEQLQELLFFPNQTAHRAEHDELLRELDRTIEDLGCTSAKLSSSTRFRLKGFFHRWILGHILTSDLEMQPYLTTSAAATRTVAA